MARRKLTGHRNISKTDGPTKKSPARKPLGPGRADTGKKAPFTRGKRMAKKGGTS